MNDNRLEKGTAKRMINRRITIHGSGNNMSVRPGHPNTEVVTKPLPCEKCQYPNCDCKDWCMICAGAVHPTNIKD